MVLFENIRQMEKSIIKLILSNEFVARELTRLGRFALGFVGGGDSIHKLQG